MQRMKRIISHLFIETTLFLDLKLTQPYLNGGLSTFF